MPSQPTGVQQQSISFGEDFVFELRPRRLRRGSHVLKLERIPLDILLLLLERAGEVVSRDEIIARIWGEGVFLDTDNSIRGAIRKIRNVLKDDAEQPAFIQTVTGKGYRFIAPVRFAQAEDAEAPIAEEPPPASALSTEPVLAMPVETGSHARISRTYWWLAAVVVAVAVSAVGFYTLQARHASNNAAKIKSLAVLPLTNLSGDPAQEYLAEGMTEELIGRLSGIRDLRVISRTSVMQFRDPTQTVPAIARILGVDAIVEGSVIREGNRIRVHAQLIRASNDEHFWSETYDRELGDALELESDIARSIAEKVQVTVSGPERARLVAARPVAPEVYEDYLKGLNAINNAHAREDVEKSFNYFEEAIRRGPEFAPAWVGLGTAYNRLGSIFIGVPAADTRPKAKAAVLKALELDPNLTQAHMLLGELEELEFHWEAARNEFLRVLQLNPNDAQAHMELANWLQCHGRTDEALAYARRARELDPGGTRGNDVAWLLFTARRYAEAERELRSDLAVHPDSPDALWHLGYVLIATGKPAEAISPLEKATTISGRSPGVLGVLVRAYAHAGRKSDALRIIEELKHRKQVGYIPAAAFINAYLGVGDKEQTFVWLERAYAEQSSILRWLKVHPHFDPIRSDPRFIDLLHRVGLD